MKLINRLLFLSFALTFNNKVYAQKYSSKTKLQLMKHFMIQGQTEKAKLVSFDLDQDNKYSKDIHNNYKAILSFIESDFEKSILYLSKISKKYDNPAHVCQLEVINLLFLQKKQELKNKWPQCYKLSISKSKNKLLWLNTLVNMSTNQETNLTKIPFKNIFIDNQNGDFLNLYLKLAIYLNREEIILPRISKISDKQFDDVKTRELIAMLYFRNNKLLQAYELIKNMDTPTSINMLAGLFMAQNKHRLAYGKYKQALQMKSTSINSLEKIIPLSINLKEYKSAQNYITRYNSLETPSQELIVLQAFLAYKNNDKKSANEIIKQILNEKNGTQGLYINRLVSLNALASNNEEDFRQSIFKSCIQNSYISCSLLAFASHYDIATVVLNNSDEKTADNNASLVDEYTKDVDMMPIDDMIIVSQKDIEEIEDRKLELTKL